MTTSKIINCRLCGSGTTAENGIDIYGKSGRKLAIASVLIKHFNSLWSDTEDVIFSKIICKKCWRTTNQFHKLYCIVEKYISKRKVEVPTENLILKIKKEDERFDYEPEQTYDNLISTMADEEDKNIHPTSVKLEELPEKNNEIEVLTTSDAKRATRPNKRNVSEEDKVIASSLEVKCEICNVKKKTFANLNIHYRRKHQISGYLRCCDRKFSKRYRLYDHIQNHFCPIQYSCDLCGKLFNCKYYLQRHIKNTHYPSQKPFKCNECHKRYESQILLNRHLSQNHTETPALFHCDICGKSCTTKYSVALHLLTMHTDKHTSICDICAKIFKSPSQLNQHYKKSHLGLGKPVVKHQCLVCGVWLSDKKVLGLHVKRIHEAKEQVCSICGKLCASKPSLAGHIRYAHRGTIYKCHLCNKIVKSQVMLKEHISTHTGINLYKCKYCTLEFKSNGNMYKHIKNVHPIQSQEDREKRLALKKL